MPLLRVKVKKYINMSFLSLVAHDLYRKRGDDFERTTVVFPNKRAGLFFARELSKLIDRPIWMPRIVTLGEFIEKHTGWKQAEELTLIFKLYAAYRECSGTAESFDEFYFWGNMLLGDFDDIDKYRVDARDLFSNLIALNTIDTSFSYLTPEQVALIRQFWSTFRVQERSPEQESFLQTWQWLYPTYLRFREKLSAEGICYEGMGQRFFCEHLPGFSSDETVVFAGFNALNQCEKLILGHYRDKGCGLFYWDYDHYYTDNKYHEAGLYIRENLKLFPPELGTELFNELRHNGKKIDFLAVPTSVGQAKQVATLLREMYPQDGGAEGDVDFSDTAVVLCDEQLLIPVLHSLPPWVDKINVTMGYPAQHTGTAALISLAGDLQQAARTEGSDTYYYHKPVLSLLQHPLVGLSPADREAVRDLITRIRKHNAVYIPSKQLTINPLTEAIFCPGSENPSGYLLRILSLILEAIEKDDRDESRIEKEVIFSLYTRVVQLKNHLEEETIQPDRKLFFRMIARIIQGISIPFSGEPLEGMQVMGLMESRMLDFKRVILLSANEGVLPKSNVASSFIPYNLRKGFMLPTPEHQDALFSYYFYRLIQRSRDIRIMYSDTSRGMVSGERSRFLYQLNFESGLPIRERAQSETISAQSPLPLSIKRNPAIFSELARYTQYDSFSVPGKGLSPSALNTYLDCRLKFYFRYIARIREQEELAEELDQRLLGNIFHEVMQRLYSTFPGRIATVDRLATLAGNTPLIEREVGTAYRKVYNADVSRIMAGGTNELVLSVVRKYIHQVLTHDQQIAPFTVIDLEESYRMSVTLSEPERKVPERGDCPLVSPLVSPPSQIVFLEGNIDRLDRTTQGIRVIDYKTGKDDTSFKDIGSLFDRENKKRNKAAFQTLLYCALYASGNPGSDPIIPGIYSTRMLFTASFDDRLHCDHQPITRYQEYEAEFTQYLTALLQELFTSNLPFDQTALTDHCKYCPYCSLCKR